MMKKHYTSNIVNTVLGLIILAVTLVFVFISGFGPQPNDMVTRFYDEPTEWDLESEKRRNEGYREDNLHVTAEDYDSLDKWDAIAVEIEVVSVTHTGNSYDDRGTLHIEFYDMVGKDTTDAYWFMTLRRERVRHPIPTEVYEPGQKIMAYGALYGDRYYEPANTHIPQMSVYLIDIID